MFRSNPQCIRAFHFPASVIASYSLTGIVDRGVVRNAQRMITQNLDDPTIGYPVTRALDHHALKFGLQGRQAGKTAFDLGKLRFGDGVGCGTGLIGIVGQAEKVADRLKGKA